MSSPLNVAIRPPALRNALLVSDDPEIDNLLMSVLRPESWTVQHTTSNASALKLVEAKPYDLIVTSEKTSAKEDISMS